ncbi:MAG TPA: plastocyanin/azurin family copper-binding protein [Chloroflexota bacterium]|nr:plastocyanin/azurin family copper-binding protein [Chloroflexota bacterium]
MKYSRVLGCIALVGLSGALVAGAGSALAGTAHQARPARVAAQMIGVAPRTWHVIAGFSQALPKGNDSTQAVNQFYPRVLTIYAGDSVRWTVNAFNEVHTVTFAPDPLLRHLEDPQQQILPKVVNGKQVMVFNPAVLFPSARGPLVESDSGSAKTLLNCGFIGPAGTPGAQSCTVTFPNVGTYAYDCLLHSGIPGNADMDGVIKVIPRPQPVNHTWTVRAGTGTATDSNDGFSPAALTIHVGDRVTWISGGVDFHTVSFGIDPLKTPLLVPVGKDAHGAPILAINPMMVAPVIPAGGLYSGGVASSGIGALTGNYLNLPGQKFIKAPFTLTFTKPGVYHYVCLVHPGMRGTISVLPATAS